MVPQTHAVLRNNDVMEHDSFTFAKNVSSFSEPSYFTFQLPYLTSIKTNAFRTLLMVFYYTRWNDERVLFAVRACMKFTRKVLRVHYIQNRMLTQLDHNEVHPFSHKPKCHSS